MTETGESSRKLQKPLDCNKHLPYADAIDEEAREKLGLIKRNLSEAVQKCDVSHAYMYWAGQLKTFVRTYGYYFTKEDHLLFINLAFELLTNCSAETHHVCSLIALLNALLKKRNLISRDDLQIPWRPVYKLFHHIYRSKEVKLGLKNYPREIESQMIHFVSHCRMYFPVESTQEILDDFRPYLCRFDTKFRDATDIFSRFLPVVTTEEEQARGFKLWFDEMIHLWLDCFSDPRPDECWLLLFTNLAHYNIGHIDWNPYLPEMFTRILRGFQLPVGKQQLGRRRSYMQLIDYHLVGKLVVSFMGGSSRVQEYLSQLLVSVDSYFHPSNTGHHTRQLESFLSHLTTQFINRLHIERFQKPNWLPRTPESSRLTEKDIDDFVDSILPALRQCLFSKFGPMEAANIYQQLALLRPQKILPELLEKMYAAFETLTEPHQLFATLQCVALVSRPLLRDTENFPEGKSHLFPLLTLAIPGIDPNDYKKTLASAMLLTELITMVPLVDCSRSGDKHGLTEMESELCSLTSQFEDFVVQLLDRCFSWIESSGLEQVALMDRQIGRPTKKFNHESLMSSGIVGTVSTILMQSSPSIAKVAIDRLFHFATSHVFESEVAGDATARLCGSASKYHPNLTLPLFVPCCVREIKELLEDSEAIDTDNPDKTLLWKLQLLSKVLNAGGEELLPYAGAILECLARCLRLPAEAVYLSASQAVGSVLQCLTQIYPMEGRLLDIHYSTPPQQHCYLRDWAAPGDNQQLNIQWHVPSAAELDLADRVLEEVLGPELDALETVCQGEEMESKELKRRLAIVLNVLQGVANYLPQFHGEQVMAEGWPAAKVSLEYGDMQCKAGAMVGRQPPERFRRKSLAVFFDKLTEQVCANYEDDTKSIISLAKILSFILSDFGASKLKLDQSWKSFRFTKKSLGDRLRKNKQHLRPVLISRVYLQHEQRIVDQGRFNMAALHLKLIKRLQALSTSSYPMVRIRSQEALARVVKPYWCAARSVLDDLPAFLRQDPGISHDQFKGALYVLRLPVMTMYHRKLDLAAKILPAIITAGHSEKPSILTLVTEIQLAIIKHSPGFQLQYEVSDRALQLASRLWQPITPEEQEEARRYLTGLNAERVHMYEQIMDKIADLFENGNLTWRFALICIQFLGFVFLHWKQPFPTRAVRVIVNCLVHDTLAIRKCAAKAFAHYLWLIKRPLKKITLDFPSVAGMEKPASCLPGGSLPGEREDNEWLLFDPKRVPQTAEEWNTFPFVDKSYIGYYTWPKEVSLTAPLDQQPSLSRTKDDMTEGEVVVFESFSSEEFVSKLLTYLSMEEKKGLDRFNRSRMEIFQRLSKIFGSSFLPVLQPHLNELAVSSNESKQRCACEIIAGLVRGSKHWPFDMLKELQAVLVPLLRQVLSSITEETIADWTVWASEVAADRDPHRIHWILQLLADNPIKESNGSFQGFSQLCVLQTALAQQEWRIGRFHTELFGQLKPHLGQSSKTVRDIMGRVLMTATMSDAGSCALRHNLTVTTVIEAFFSALPKPVLCQDYNLEEEDTKVQLRILKTAVNWILDLLPMGGLKKEYIPLLTVVLPLVNIEGDDELTGLLQEMFAFVSHAELPSGAVRGVMDMVQMSTESSSWKIRKPGLHVLQVTVFSNLFKFAPHSPRLNELLMGLMRDENVEVCEVASDTVSGLMRCGLFAPTPTLQKHFKKLSHSKVAKKQIQEESTDGMSDKRGMAERHAGVLGLAALVGSCPYTVPEWLPDVLEELAGHLHDRAPIPATVKRAMNDFKRTHYDNWRDHTHQAISADLGGSKLPVVSKVKHDPLSQDDDSDEENQPEDYVPPMNLGVPSHHLDKTELDPFSALKGAKPSGVRSSGQIVHPSNVCLVCIVCLDGLNNKVFSLKNHCKDPSTHPLVTMVKGFHCPEMLTQIRPSGCSKEHDGVTMCPDWPNCFLGDKCTHPHSQEELIAWTDKTPTREVCLPCRWDRILHSGLLEYVCLTGKHPPDARRVVILDVVQNEFVHLHMPPSNCVNRFEHRMADCSMGTRWSQCQYPHSELEFRVWTSLRAHTFSSETHFHQMLLKTASSGVGFKATDRFVTLDRKYLFEQEEFVSQSRLDVSNYVARFQALLDLEEVVHWEKLRKYNGKYTWCEEGNEVLKLKMHHETDADIVYQSAMEATLFSTNIELTGKLCGVDKVSEKTSYLHVQIDSGSMKFLRRHKESLPLSIQVCFRLKEWYFRTLRKAVSDLPDTIEEILMPKRPHFPHYSTLVRDSVRELPEELQLDDKNKQSAFERIMNLSNMPSAPYLVLGPFGTGKTRLIAAAAWSLLKGAPKRKILIATHHIETANSYAKDCGYLQNDHDIRIVRVVSDTQKGKRKGHTEYTKTVSEALQKRLLLTCNLIVTTFIVSQKLSQMAKSSIGRFSHIFIDEGAQAREPETVAAFSCADKVTKIIIAGDHMQVGPDSQVLGIKPLKYGLGTSLLARLHEYYRTEGVKEVSEAYQSVLLSNYRCHSAILRLPGRLFYDSSLQSCKIQELHPDMKNPLTFVCTSLDLVPDCFDPEAEGKARDCEISTLFSWVLKCAESWPTVEWGRRKMSALCVILPSRLMSRLWKKQVSRWYEEQNQLPLHMRSRVNMEHVSTRVSWDIQGREYRGVFLSTSEPVDIKNYSPEESTKGICEPTVFNTIVTRAQSLIVACGNPFRILEVEANTKGSKGCWMEFFHRCIENKALLLSESISGERRQHAMALQNLETTMFEQASADIVGIPEMISDAVDSIIESYHKEFNKANEQFALGGSGSVNPSGWKHWDLHEGEEQIVSAGTSTHQHEVECRLWQTERGHCEAFPSVRSEQKFLIKLNNRRCAFEGALVKVVEIPKHKETGPRIGRVISILEQGSTEPVLCEVNRKNVLAFVSVDRKTPNFLNLPHIVNANKNTASSSATKYVTCFDPKSLKKGSVPKISDSIPLEMASNLLFLVQPLYWKPQHHHPIGAVVGSFPKGTSIAHTIKILAIQYQVPNLKASQTGTVPEQLQNIPADVTHAIGVRDHNGLCQVAFSVTETDKQCKKISIHVADVTSFVNESYADFEAAVMQRVLLRRELECEQFGTSVSQPVLSAEVLSHASFSDSAEPVVSFTVSFVTSEHVAIPERLMNYEIKPNTNVLCKYVLKFKDLQDILHGKLTRQAQTRVADIELLYKVAEKLHFDRKKHNGYSNLQPHSCSYPDAWKLVNEFSILANKVAALNIARSFPKYALMKVQLPLSVPGEGEIADLLSHLALFERLPPQLESKNVDQQKKIFLSRTVCDEVLSSLEGKSPDLLKAKQLLSLPLHHSHLLVRDAVVRDYTQREEYAVRKITSKGKKNLEERLAKLEDPVNVPHLAHYSLECVCSSITCPFESTFDIHTQKLLKHALTMRSHEGGEGKPDKLHQIAHKCNLSSLNASGYLTTSKSVQLANSAQISSLCVAVVIKQVKDDDGLMHFAFPFLAGLDFHSLSKIKLSTITGSSQLKSAEKMLNITAVSSSIRILKEPSFHCVTKDQGQELLVFRQSETAESTVTNLVQKSVFIAYEPDCLSVEPAQWSTVKEFVENPGQASARKLSTFLERLCPSKHKASGRTQTLSKSIRTKDLSDSKEAMSRTSLSKEQLQSLLQDYCNTPFVILKASIPFKPLQTLKMWIRADMEEYVATPKPQVLELSPDVRICLQHLSDPEACFTKGVMAESAKLQYSTINHYCRVWENLVLAEAVVIGSRETQYQSSIISDFMVKFSGFAQPQDCLTENYYEPSGEIYSVFPKSFLTSCQDIFRFEPGYFVCAKYEIDLDKACQTIPELSEYTRQLHPARLDNCARFVLHMIVQKVVTLKPKGQDSECEVKINEENSTIDSDVKVIFKMPSIPNARMSPLMKVLLEVNDFTCELQTLPMFLSIRRVYDVMMHLPLLEAGSLPLCVACGSIDDLSHLTVPSETEQKIKAIIEEYPLIYGRWTGDTSRQLNAQQKKSINCSLRNRFQLIQGPPGTGKSVTGAHIAYAFAMVNRKLHPKRRTAKDSKAPCVLYCAPTNAAVDAVFKMLADIAAKKAKDLRILRVYGRGIEKKFYPCPFTNSDVFSSYFSDYSGPSGLKHLMLHHVIHSDECPYSTELLELEDFFKACIDKKEIPSPSCRDQYRLAQSNAEKDVLTTGKYDIILCTCNESAGSRIRTHLSPLQCIVDEASMVTEPESMAPISISQQVVLIGDHKQLQPFVLSDVAKHNHMDVSLFERYINLIDEKYEDRYKCKLFVSLNNQYRMMRVICELPSDMFYDSNLKTDTINHSVEKREAFKDLWPREKYPLVFCHIEGKETVGDKITGVDSKKNEEEADKVAEIVKDMAKLASLSTDKFGANKVTVGVLTYYKAQVALIRDKLKKNGLQDCASVLSVDASQGSEYDFVILSTVRSKFSEDLKDKELHKDRQWMGENIGFVQTPHRLCVALTRTCLGLVIVGNSNLLQLSESWQPLIHWYKERKCIWQRNEFPILALKKKIEHTSVATIPFFKKKPIVEDEYGLLKEQRQWQEWVKTRVLGLADLPAIVETDHEYDLLKEQPKKWQEIF